MTQVFLQRVRVQATSHTWITVHNTSHSRNGMKCLNEAVQYIIHMTGIVQYTTHINSIAHYITCINDDVQYIQMW